MDRKLHVLIVTTWYPNGTDKLIGVYHKLFCEALAAQGSMQVNMLYIDRQGISSLPRYPFMTKYYTEQNAGYTTFCRRMLDISKLGFDAQMRAYTNMLLRLYKRYEEQFGKPDVIHAQVAVPAGYAACMLGEKIGVPVVITEHSSYFERFFAGREQPYCEYVMKHAARITCVGEHMLAAYRKRGVEAEVLPNIVDCTAFSGQKQKAKDGKLHLASVCALREEKRLDDVIAALRILRDKNALPDFCYTVVGDGYEMPNYTAAAERLQMTDCVEFVGRKSSVEVARILSETDMLVMASDTETFGIPAVEALAAGAPVVCTHCKGPEGFLDESCAEFCDVHAPEQLADAIERMYRRLDTIDEGHIRGIAAQFDSAAVAQRALDIYRAVCNL